MVDLDKITLTKNEKRLLKRIYKSGRFLKSKAPKNELLNLYKFELINDNHSSTPVLGRFPIDGTVSVTSNYKRYKKRSFSNFIERKVPIILSIIAIIISVFALLKP